MLVLDLRELQQKLANRRIACRARGLAIEARSLKLHGLGIFAHVVDPERPRQPKWLLRDETLDVLAAYKGQILAELRAVEVEQHGAVAHLLLCHLVENLGRGGKFFPQSLRKAAVNAAVLLLIGDGKSDNLLFREIGKALHGDLFPAAAVKHASGGHLCTDTRHVMLREGKPARGEQEGGPWILITCAARRSPPCAGSCTSIGALPEP